MLVFSTCHDEIETRLEGAIREIVPLDRTTFCREMNRLADLWRRPAAQPRVVLIRAADRTELAGLMPLRAFFGDTRVILVVPDEDWETLALAHRFRPNYLTLACSDFKDVAAVLRKLTRSPAWLVGSAGLWGEEP